MAKPTSPERQDEDDRKQVRRHFVHWGVKTVATLVFATLAGVLWLAWVSITGRR